MPDESEDFYLFLASSEPEGATSHLKTSGVLYKRKRLDSGPENWATIVELLQSPKLVGVAAKFTSDTCRRLAQPTYNDVANQFLQTLSEKRHILFIHESLLSDDPNKPTPEPNYDDPDFDFFHYQMTTDTLTQEQREFILQIIDDHRLNLVPYRRNAELSVLASKFVQQHDKNLLFRVYIPSGRMWANEADKLLTLFSDWVSRFKRQHIRRDGYTTPQGQVHEFYSEESLQVPELTNELRQFSDFLELCIEDPDAARKVLERDGSPQGNAAAIIARYAREARRLALDLRHERQSRLLTIMQRLENEFLESDIDIESTKQLAASMVPNTNTGITGAISATLATLPSGPSIVVHQQYIGTVHGVVAQEINGTVQLNPEASQLLDLIAKFGGKDQVTLESSVHELEDKDARASDRLAARQKLKGFLFKIAGQIGEVGLSALRHYLEGQIGAQ